MAECESSWSVVDGLRLHARVWTGAAPAGRPPLVLVHGAAVSSLHMEPTGEVLADEFAVYAPDLPGHGRSDNPERVHDARGLAGALAGWIERNELGRVHLLGNSFGCQIIAELAVARPELVDRAVLQGPTTDPDGHGLRQLWRWGINFWREGATQPQVTFRQWAQAGPRVFARTLYSMDRHRIEELLPRVDAPTLVVRGSRDPIIPPSWAEEATRLLPRGQLAVIPDETHTIVVSAPEALADAVLPFLLDGDDGGAERGS